jgi:hypothetical protein
MSGNRRDRFRRFLTALSLAPPADADGATDVYVKRPDLAAAEQIAARLEIEPASSHLLVGGIGCGKTTQLYLIERHLRGVGDVRPIYVDVAKHHDLQKMRPGVLFALAGLEIAAGLQEPQGAAVAAAAAEFVEWAHGTSATPEFLAPDLTEWRPGILAPPNQFEGDLASMMPPFRLLVRAAEQSVPHVVMLFDSLDRLMASPDFIASIQPDIDAFDKSGVGVVVVAPLSVMFGPSRTVLDRFSSLHRVPAVDPRSFDGGSFLAEVLRRRLPEDVLGSLVRGRIISSSGGVLRDLLWLTHNAVQNAYVSGKDAVEAAHVDIAAEALGRQLLYGVPDEKIKILQRVQGSFDFTPVSQAEIDLLAFRQIVEYLAGGRSRYAVHPAIEPLLRTLSVQK